MNEDQTSFGSSIFYLYQLSIVQCAGAEVQSVKRRHEPRCVKGAKLLSVLAIAELAGQRAAATIIIKFYYVFIFKAIYI